MQNKYLKKLFLLVLPMVIIGVLGGPITGSAQAGLDMIVKIRDLDNFLLKIDDLSTAATENQTGLSPTDMLRGMLQGTDWIDPARLIVLGAARTGEKTAAAVLIPFQTANENFQKLYNAKAGGDYYLVGLPPGQAVELPEDALAEMVSASRTSSNMALIVELAVSTLLANNKTQIDQWLHKIEDMPPQAQTSGQTAPSPAHLREMMTRILETAGELKNITMGVDLDQTDLKTTFTAKAKKKSRLYQLFSEKSDKTKLTGYKSVQDVDFQSLAYDVEGMLALVDSLFGQIYEQIGIDFGNIASLGEHFTGEAAGGMSFAKDGVSFEMLAALKKEDAEGTFTEAVYLPWLMQYSRDLSRMMEKQLQAKVEPMFVRTPGSTVNGRKVAGVKFQFPVFPVPGDLDGSAKMSRMMNYSFRMTTVGDLVVMAPNDQRLGEMIDLAGKLQRKPFKGPLLQGTIDMSRYLNYLLSMMADTEDLSERLPATGRMTFTMDVRDGEIHTASTMPMAGIKALMAYSQKMVSAAKAGTVAGRTASRRTKEQPSAGMPEEAPTGAAESALPLDPQKDPNFWFDRGGLLSTYGNDQAAIKAYLKSLELDPGRSQTHFNLGVSYGETGQYELALASINRAIELNPTNGLYYYGRARVHLLAGEEDKALEDLKRAAAAGDPDAQQYLREHSN
jgi:Flp pilus assembly protein TadD